MVLTLSGDHVTEITGFADISVFRSFGCPQTVPGLLAQRRPGDAPRLGAPTYYSK
jgi:hypothetical protein